MKGQKIMENGVSFRKRGRPQGKGRTPLSLEERRARNAQYERERRMENSDAMAELAESIGCRHSELSNADLLATVITYLKKVSVADPSRDLEALKRINESLNKQIENIEHRIAEDPELAGLTMFDSEDENVLLYNNLHKETRKKIKHEAIEPKTPCSRTTQFSYARYSRLKRDDQQLEAMRERIIKTESDNSLDCTIKTEHPMPEILTIKTEFKSKENILEEHKSWQMQPMKTEHTMPEVNTMKTESTIDENSPSQVVKTENTLLLEMGAVTSPDFTDDDASSDISQICNPDYTDYAGRENKQVIPSQMVAPLEVALSDSDDGVLTSIKKWSIEEMVLKYL